MPSTASTVENTPHRGSGRGRRDGASASGAPASSPSSSTAPAASSSGRALIRHSSYSASGSEPHVMPPPAPSHAFPPAISNVRMATLSSRPAMGLA